MLSAAGALMSDLRREFARTEFDARSHFDADPRQRHRWPGCGAQCAALRSTAASAPGRDTVIELFRRGAATRTRSGRSRSRSRGRCSIREAGGRRPESATSTPGTRDLRLQRPTIDEVEIVGWRAVVALQHPRGASAGLRLATVPPATGERDARDGLLRRDRTGRRARSTISTPCRRTRPSPAPPSSSRRSPRW